MVGGGGVLVGGGPISVLPAPNASELFLPVSPSPLLPLVSHPPTVCAHSSALGCQVLSADMMPVYQA